MRQTILVLITATEKNKKRVLALVDYLCRQREPVQKIAIIYTGTERYFCKTFKGNSREITWIENNKNESLTYLQNQAIRSAAAEFILMLNDDVILENNFLSNLVDSMKKNEKIGIACGKILRMDKITIDSAGQLLGKNRKPIDRGYGEKDAGQFDTSEYVFGACGAAVLYRRKMLEDIQIAPGEYFDNDYHMYYEDLDISWRAQNKGWKTYYNPGAVCYHVRGATAKQNKPLLRIFGNYNFAWLPNKLKADVLKNRYMTIIKNDNFKDFLINLPFILFYDLKIFSYCLFFSPIVIFKTIENIPKIMRAWEKRAQIQKKVNHGS